MKPKTLWHIMKLQLLDSMEERNEYGTDSHTLVPKCDFL